MSGLDYHYIARLVLRTISGDNDAFAEIYAATYQRLYRYCYNYLKDEHLAQDALQETFVIAYQKMHCLKNPELFISWLNQICFRVCFDMAKKSETGCTPLDEYPLEISSSEINPEDHIINIDHKDYIARQIMCLPFAESQVILLRYYQNMKIEDIADIMDISRSSVKRYLESGRKKLKHLLSVR